MDDVTIYVDMRIPSCRTLVLYLSLAEIDFEMKKVNSKDGDLKKKGYTTMFPTQSVPGMKDDEFHLSSMMAIVRYMTTKFGGDREIDLYPEDIESRARVDEYIDFHYTFVSRRCDTLFRTQVLNPEHSGKSADKTKVQTDADSLKMSVDRIESCFLKNNNFLCGDAITFADILAVCEFSQFIVNRRDVFKNNYKMKGYMDRVKARLQPAFKKIHAEIYAWRDSRSK